MRKYINIAERGSTGVTVVRIKPRDSPSLANYRDADEGIRKSADELWGSSAQYDRVKGSGRVYNGVTTADALRKPEVGAWLLLRHRGPASA